MSADVTISELDAERIDSKSNLQHKLVVIYIPTILHTYIHTPVLPLLSVSTTVCMYVHPQFHSQAGLRSSWDWGTQKRKGLVTIDDSNPNPAG